MTRIGCGLLVILFAALIGTNGWWAYRALNSCDRFVFREAVSPNGKSAVFLFYNNCGATTSFSTQAILQSSGEAFSPGEHRPFLIVKQLHAIEVHWLDNAKIEAIIPTGGKIYRRDPSVDGIAIRYRH